LGWFIMNREYLGPRITLVEQRRWGLGPGFDRTHGIAYLEGKVYLAGWDSGRLGVLDVSAGGVADRHPRSGQDVLGYTRPGDPKVGLDGLLYVLNNGSGAQSMYVMRPDGQVVRQVTLANKTEVAAGLGLGRDNAIYVGDTLGGKILKYGQDGGEPTAIWGGETGRFNNVVGIAVDDDGAIYAAEHSSHRVQQLDSEGRFVRKLDLKCNPEYVAIRGDWLDVTCGNRLLSIHRQGWYLRRSRLADDSSPLGSPRGLTYGPDGTLYVADGGALIAYRLQP
jgi:sugar lactone lactonase YvrE